MTIEHYPSRTRSGTAVAPIAGDRAPRVSSGKSNNINVGPGEQKLSMIAGGLLTLRALNSRSGGGLTMLALGGALLYRGLSGHCPLYQRLGISEQEGFASRVIAIDESLTINKPRAEVYAFWQNLENLPKFMHHLISVTRTGDNTTHWIARAPRDFTTVEWDAEMLELRTNALIAWHSLQGADIRNTGRVEFSDAAGGRGTQLRVRILYQPPAGPIGAAAAGLLNPLLGGMIKQELRRLRSLLETGEIPTTEGQPSGRRSHS
jgi:uncharacterized membrane protein